MRKTFERYVVPIFILCTLVIAVLTSVIVYQNKVLLALQKTSAHITKDLEDTKESLQKKETELREYDATLGEVRQAFAVSEENGAELLRMLTDEKERNDVFEKQIRDATKTVGKLDKLSKIDAELLMKYSKVYFLNEHYVPESVVLIASSSRLKTDEAEYIQEKVAPFLEDMLEEAKEDGIELLVVSAYRSFDEQKSLKSAYSVQYGSGANTFSADQGYSEHQLGTTIDLTTSEIGGGLVGFEKTEAYAWLLKYAHRYGFVLSYPERNGYYIFEPWHWRFVGEDLARELHDRNMYFYDMEQREIDTYLISIFD